MEAFHFENRILSCPEDLHLSKWNFYSTKRNFLSMVDPVMYAVRNTTQDL